LNDLTYEQPREEREIDLQERSDDDADSLIYEDDDYYYYYEYPDVNENVL